MEQKTTGNKYLGRIGKQYKSILFDVKELSLDSTGRTISGYAAVFGNIDKAGDLLVKGCFAKSISERGPESNANDKIIFLWMHDMNEPIGKITVLREDDHGLYFEAVIDKIELGDRAIVQLESGTLNQFSIGFNYIFDNCEWDATGEFLIVKEVILYEISVVSIGCNGDTQYLGLKNFEDAEEKYKKLQKELDDICGSLATKKSQRIQQLFSKAMRLASYRPEKNDFPPSDRADSERERDTTIFQRTKFKN